MLLVLARRLLPWFLLPSPLRPCRNILSNRIRFAQNGCGRCLGVVGDGDDLVNFDDGVYIAADIVLQRGEGLVAEPHSQLRDR